LVSSANIVIFNTFEEQANCWPIGKTTRNPALVHCTTPGTWIPSSWN